MLLDKKNIIVVGGSSGIGRSAVKAFLNEGAFLTVIGRNSKKLLDVEIDLGNNGITIKGDASSPETINTAIKQSLNKFGDLHGLYHVAGGSGREKGDGPIHEISDKAWDYTISINLDSIFYSNRAIIQQFINQGKGGAILNMSSVLGFSPSSKFFSTHAYASTKAAIVGLSKSLASYYSKYNIRINVISPGLIATPMSKRAQSNKNILSYIKQKQSLDGGRIGEAIDLDGAATYFMSDKSSFTTGQVLSIDGGWSVNG